MSARSIWKGDLSLGLVTIAVAAYKATDDATSGIKTSWLHSECKHPINLHKVCTHCAKTELAMSDIVTGVAEADGTHLVLSADELKGLKAPTSDAIAVDAFVAADSIDPLLVETTYYLGPGKVTHGYVLLREAMTQAQVVLTGRLTLYGRESQVAIRPHGAILLLQVLRTADEVRNPQALPGVDALRAPIDVQQLALMKQLMGLYAGAFDAAAYEDGYIKAFQELVAAKRSGTVVAAPVPVAAPPVVDFMAALKASLAAAPTKAAKVPKVKAAKAATKPRGRKAADAEGDEAA